MLIRRSLLRTTFSKIPTFVQVRFLLANEFDLRIGIKEYSEWPTIPQLYVNGEFIGGCDIVMNMHQSGELEKILENAGVLVPDEDVEENDVKKSV